MSSKKKLVLGLGHLSVAMLGVSLLVANPVSAEEDVSSQSVSTVATTQGGSDTTEQHNEKTSQGTAPGVVIELIEESDNGEERILGSTQSPYFKGRDDGYEAGYQDGQKEDAPENPTDATPELSKNPYTTSGDKAKETHYETGYQDTYASGYRRGWDEKHYIWSTLRNMWQWLISWVR
uniref:hypothetical protein n=1 Tax=Streptococcus canis TaxID=1329 RepID=UPI0024AC9EEF|nr:hypothetical protein [Streptococcus canis]